MSIGGNNDITFIYIKPFLASAGIEDERRRFHLAKAAGDRFSALVAAASTPPILNHPTYAKATRSGSRTSATPSPLPKTFPSRSGPRTCPGPRRTAARWTAFARSYKRGVRWLYDPAQSSRPIDILLKYARQDRKDLDEAYEYQVAKLKTVRSRRRRVGQGLRENGGGLAEIGFIKKPYPPKRPIFDGSFVQQATN
jgi:hypothetical protein